MAQDEQKKISLRAALTEIDELKQSQRCVEISLAKQIEENEQLQQKLSKQNKAYEDLEEEMGAKQKELGEAQFQIDSLNKKISSFSKNQGQVSFLLNFKEISTILPPKLI